jgi:hypothetical protein
MTNNLLIEETLDELIKGMEIDKLMFYKSYKALPLAIYIEIERLSVLKICIVQKSLCAKARIAFIEASNQYCYFYSFIIQYSCSKDYPHTR